MSSSASVRCDGLKARGASDLSSGEWSPRRCCHVLGAGIIGVGTASGESAPSVWRSFFLAGMSVGGGPRLSLVSSLSLVSERGCRRWDEVESRVTRDRNGCGAGRPHHIEAGRDGYEPRALTSKTSEPLEKITLKQLFTKEFAGVLVTDFWGADNALFYAPKQKCRRSCSEICSRPSTTIGPVATGRSSPNN
jgi:hypothetical protein